MPRFAVPVFYTMCGVLHVDAENEEEAIGEAVHSSACIDDLKDTGYCDGSWEVGDDPHSVERVSVEKPRVSGDDVFCPWCGSKCDVVTEGFAMSFTDVKCPKCPYTFEDCV